MPPCHPATTQVFFRDHRVMSKKGKEIALPPEGILGHYLGLGG